MTAHTPGPWTLFEKPGGYRRKPVVRIKRVGVSCNESCHVARVDRVEDARLIAAAPDLLDALTKLCEAHEEVCPSKLCCARLMKARAAIAKATQP